MSLCAQFLARLLIKLSPTFSAQFYAWLNIFWNRMSKCSTQAEFWAGLKIGPKNRLNLVKKFCLHYFCLSRPALQNLNFMFITVENSNNNNNLSNNFLAFLFNSSYLGFSFINVRKSLKSPLEINLLRSFWKRILFEKQVQIEC